MVGPALLSQVGAPLGIARRPAVPQRSTAAFCQPRVLGRATPSRIQPSGIVPLPAQRIQPAPQVAPKRISVKAQAAAADAAQPAPQAQGGLVASLKKILPLGLIFLCATFNYTILQTLKDAVVVTQVGAEVLPFLGSYGVLPCNVAFFAYYSWITKNLPEKMVFYMAVVPFIAFYTAYALVLQPMAGVLQPQWMIDAMLKALPGGLAGLAKMVGYWLYSLFFAVAETWGGVVISVLFWGLANEVCTMAEAREVYPRLGIIANVGVVGAGWWIKFVNKTLAKGNELASLRILTATLVVMVGIMFLNKAFVDKEFLSAPRTGEKVEKKKKKKGQADAGVWEFVKKSQKTRDLGVLVVAYFVTAKLFDFAWKAQMKIVCPDSVAFQQVMGDVFQYTGITTITLMAVSGLIFKHLGWAGGALATPVLMFATGALFFASALVSQGMLPLPAQIATMVMSAGFVGGIATRVFSKASKYSLFDPSKEMVYISMEKDEKVQGKAAVDMLASSFGKSGASWLTQALVLVFGTFVSAMPCVAAIYMSVCAAWVFSTFNLASQVSLPGDKNEKKAEDKPVDGSAPAPGREIPSGLAGSAPVTAASGITATIDGGSVDEGDKK